MAFAHDRDRLQAIHPRHGKVEQHDIGTQPGDRLDAGGGIAPASAPPSLEPLSPAMAARVSSARRRHVVAQHDAQVGVL